MTLSAPRGLPQMADPVETQAVRLLSGKLLIKTQSGIVPVIVEEVEPYIHAQSDNWIPKIMQKVRRPGEIMVLPAAMGNRAIFLIVDQEYQQRIVRLTKFRLGNEVVTLKRLCDRLGISKNQLDLLDGELLITKDTEANIRLEDDPSTKLGIPNIVQNVKGAVVNSLGTWQLQKFR